jgi:hypothetical protein
MRVFAPDTSRRLKNYVYLYRDPETGSVFYVGRGVGNRCFAHLKDDSDPMEYRKVAIIRRLRNSARGPIIDILRSGLTEREARLLEASAIDLIGLSILSNIVGGDQGRGARRRSVQSIIDDQNARNVIVTHKAILIRINRKYREGMSSDELYAATRGRWKIGPRGDRAEYALAVFEGVVKEVYKIKEWNPRIGRNQSRKQSVRAEGRREFEGVIAPQSIRRKYLGKSVRDHFSRGSQNPIRYVNI